MEDSYQWDLGGGGTDLRKMVTEMYGDYKVKGKGTKNSNALVVASSSG